jgi:hypothetical protein
MIIFVITLLIIIYKHNIQQIIKQICIWIFNENIIDISSHELNVLFIFLYKHIKKWRSDFFV